MRVLRKLIHRLTYKNRQALANVLEIPDRVDWKVCRKSTEEETADAVKFKRDFKEYDFTLE